VTSGPQQILTFMLAQKGKGYTETNPTRFGPNEFDCSGLVYTAAHHAGYDIPQGDAIAAKEAPWFAALPGAQVIKNQSQIQAGDLVFFPGSDPGSSPFGPIGHVGMAISPTQYVSAYDTQEGVVTGPIGTGNSGFTVAIRIPGAVESPGTASGSTGGLPSQAAQILGWISNPLETSFSGVTAAGDSIAAVGKEIKGITDFFDALTMPQTWVRIGATLAGLFLTVAGVLTLAKVAEGNTAL